MDAQEIFDTVHKHLIEQDGQSYNLGCCYRSLDGRKCAVGCLIPDDQYTREMEGHMVDTLCENFRSATLHFAEHVVLLSDLQSLHDEALVCNGDGWAAYINTGMADIASEHSLRFTPRTKGQA